MKRVRVIFFAMAALGALAACQPASNQTSALEARVQALEDHIAIEKLLMQYPAAFGTKDADAYLATFTPEALLELHLKDENGKVVVRPFNGREALRKQFFANAAPTPASGVRPWGSMRHVTTNSEINVQGDKATHRGFFIEMVSSGQNSPPGSKPPLVHAMGRYEDDLVKQDGKWLFAKRRVIVDLNTKWEPDPPRTP